MFVFDKKALISNIQKLGLPKSATEDVLDRLRREVAALAKIRHPDIVRIIEPLSESKADAMFVTEPLSACLKSIVDSGSSQSSQWDLDELAIQKGLLQIVEGLNFMHKNMGLVHLDVQPSSILIDSKGDWKLGGIGFSESYKGGSDYFISQFDPRLPNYVHLNLDFSAPELVLDRRLDPSNDVFSLGCTILYIYTLKAPMSNRNSSSEYRNEIGNVLRAVRDRRIPSYLTTILPRVVERQPIQRITLDDLKQSEFFDNVLIRTINFLDDFPAKLASEKKTFLSGLLTMLPQFPQSILQRKILHSLTEELGKDDTLTYLLLQNLFTIGKDMSQLGFGEKILPSIVKVKDQYTAQQAMVDFLEIVKGKVAISEFKETILPILMTTLETAPPDTQTTLLVKTETFTADVDFVTLKNDVFPKVSSVFSKTTSLSVKLEALKSFNALLAGGLDRFTIVEKLLPLLGAMKTREPKIIVTALQVYSSIVEMVDVETLAKEVVPQLLGLSMESLLSREQFHMFTDKIKKIIDRIETEHARKLSTAPSTELRSSTPLNSKQESASPVDFETLISRPSNKDSNSINTPVMGSSVSTNPTVTTNATNGGTRPPASSSMSPPLVPMRAGMQLNAAKPKPTPRPDLFQSNSTNSGFGATSNSTLMSSQGATLGSLSNQNTSSFQQQTSTNSIPKLSQPPSWTTLQPQRTSSNQSINQASQGVNQTHAQTGQPQNQGGLSQYQSLL